MVFKATAVDIRGKGELEWFDPRFPTRIYPMIKRTLPSYADGVGERHEGVDEPAHQGVPTCGVRQRGDGLLHRRFQA